MRGARWQENVLVGRESMATGLPGHSQRRELWVDRQHQSGGAVGSNYSFEKKINFVHKENT